MIEKTRRTLYVDCEYCGKPGVFSLSRGVCEYCGKFQSRYPKARTPEENRKRRTGMILGGLLLMVVMGCFSVKMIKNDPGYIAAIQSHDTQIADTIHTAVLTAIIDQEIKAKKEYAADLAALTETFDITEYQTGGNCILDEAVRILNMQDLSVLSLSKKLRSDSATGRIWVTVTERKGSDFPEVEVVLEGAIDYGEGGQGKREITVR